MAERLGVGLQNLLRRFDPVHDLCEKLNLMAVVRGVFQYTPFYFIPRCCAHSIARTIGTSTVGLPSPSMFGAPSLLTAATISMARKLARRCFHVLRAVDPDKVYATP